MNQFTTKRGHNVLSVGNNSSEMLPGIFYFALSAHDSLNLDPFNQPVELWKEYPVRIYSMTIPGHDEHFVTDKAIDQWAKEYKNGSDILSPFFTQVAQAIEDLIEMKLLDPAKVAISGVSRGSFVAAHVAAKVKQISHILGFAPLTTLMCTKQFSDTNAQNLDLLHLCESLYTRTHRYYIGNYDVRVSTAKCFEYFYSLSKLAHEKKVREAPIELIIKPSIGRFGHGTNKQTFEEGAYWLIKSLLQENF